MSAAAKKRTVMPARARMSAVLQQIDDLIGELDELRAGGLEPALDAVMDLYAATFDARRMIGDHCDDNGNWHVAARRQVTRAELAELRRLGKVWV
jgi:hypothetical protein